MRCIKISNKLRFIGLLDEILLCFYVLATIYINLQHRNSHVFFSLSLFRSLTEELLGVFDITFFYIAFETMDAIYNN